MEKITVSGKGKIIVGGTGKKDKPVLDEKVYFELVGALKKLVLKRKGQNA